MFRFLVSWLLRLALIGAVVGVFGSGGWLAGLGGWAVFVYLIWAGRRVVFRHVRVLWSCTSLRAYLPRMRFRLGRMRGETL